MALEQLDLFGNIVTDVTGKKDKSLIEEQQLSLKQQDEGTIIPASAPLNTAVTHTKPNHAPIGIAIKPDASLIFLEDEKPTDVHIYKDDKIVVKLKAKTNVNAALEQEPLTHTIGKRGRKSYKELETTADLIHIPDDETLQKKLYYGIGEVAEWFHVNASQIRFWENEFDILKPRKTKKGDRLFRVEDIKNLQLIYHLLRTRKFSIEGAKEYLKTHKEQADVNYEITQSLTKFRSFLLELKANLST